MAPQGPSAPQGQGNGLAITALVLGILSVVLCWFPLLAAPLGIVALVLGIVALRKRQAKGMSLTGIITGGVGVLISIIVIIISAIVFATAISTANNYTDEYTEQSEAVYELEFRASVNSGDASVSYSTGGSSSSTDITAEEWSETATLEGYDAASLVVTGDYETSDQEVTCELILDGEVVDSQSGTTSVSCSASTF
ncbi:hypothetical protein FM119_08355 [Mycetocola reblochoni REB411]|uniref:DUF4190 domain-containing protein n=1 Tax=Mycetocola reblochoni REB411 TaxID=1255698 RepID=A0A1R4JMR6_9MICO|nr:hypothetical protein FM119_08355 [Mycetocola reblochoni REB411]